MLLLEVSLLYTLLIHNLVQATSRKLFFFNLACNFVPQDILLRFLFRDSRTLPLIRLFLIPSLFKASTLFFSNKT